MDKISDLSYIFIYSTFTLKPTQNHHLQDLEESARQHLKQDSINNC